MSGGVLVTGPSTDGENGSGWVIGDQYVLTAGHVVFEYDGAHQNEPSLITNADIVTSIPSPSGNNSNNVALDYRDYQSKYADRVRTDLINGNYRDIMHEEAKLVANDAVVISSNKSVGKSDAGLVFFLDGSSLLNPASSVPGASVSFWGYVSGTVGGGSITSAADGALTYDVPDQLGDSGGAFLLNTGSKKYVIGTIVARDNVKSYGTYFTAADFAAINAIISAGKSGDVNSEEPTDLIVGTSGADTVTGTFRSDRILGLAGDDALIGDPNGSSAWGDDTLIGGDGNDTVKGGKGNDTLYGGSENGSTADDGVDHLDGGEGDDKLDVGAGDFIDDVDKGDQITFGIRLTGGERTASLGTGESGTYTSKDGKITYNYDSAAHTVSVTTTDGTIMISGFENGEAGITLATKDQPDAPTAPGYVSHPGQPSSPPPATNDRGGTTERGGKNEYANDVRDPLVLDLNGDGVKLLSATANTIYFDGAGDGLAERTGWVNPQDGLLVRDLDGDGAITSGRELFGDSRTEGFAALRQFDDNGDGWITSADQVWSTLKVWVDANSNGVTDAGELRTLSSLSIDGLNLYSEPNSSILEGNPVVQGGAYRTSDGASHQMLSVDFGIVTGDTQFTPATDVSDQVAALPNLNGLGGLTDLRTAMAGNQALADEVQSLVEDARSLDGAAFRSRLEQVLLDWAGVGSVPRSAYGMFADGRHMAFLEKAENTEIRDFTADGGQSRIIWHSSTAMSLENKFRDLVDYYALRFGIGLATSEEKLGIDPDARSSGPFAPLNDLHYDAVTGAVTGTVNYVVSKIAAGMPADASDAVAYLDRVMPLLASTASLSAQGGDFNWTSDQLGSVVRQGFAEAGVTNAALIEYAVGRTVPDAVSWTGTDGNDDIDADSTPVHRAAAIDPGKGDDHVTLSTLQTSMVYRAGDGDDVVQGNGGVYVDAPHRLELVDLNSGDVSFSDTGDGVRFAVNSPEGGSVTVKGQLDGVGFDEIDFADGTRLTGQQIATQIDATRGTAAADTIAATAYDDRITPGHGNDLVSGLGIGTDTVVYTAGDGNDILLGQGFGLELHGVTPDQVSLGRDEDGYGTVSFLDNGGGVIRMAFGLPALSAISFDDGSTLSSAQIQARYQSAATTAGDDVIYGGPGADVFASSAGDDTIVGGGGADVFQFKSGDGQDLIDSSGSGSGGGQVSLQDLTQAQVHFEKSGQGGFDLKIVDDTNPASSVTIRNALLEASNGYLYDGIGSIRFSDGSSVSIGQAEAQALAVAATVGDDVIVGTSDDDMIDGLAGDDTISGGSGADTLIGGLGDDMLDGGEDADRLIGGKGDDHIYAGVLRNVYTPDTIVFSKGDGNDVIEQASDATLELKGFSRSELVFTRLGNDGYTISGSDPSDGSIQVELGLSVFGQGGFDALGRILLDDGTVIKPSEVLDYILSREGTPGDDDLTDFDGHDSTLTGGRGDDTLTGRGGSDTYVYNAGDGDDLIREQGGTESDTIRLKGIAPSDVTVSRDGVDAVLTIAGASPGSIRVAGQFAPQAGLNYYSVVENVVFDDGTVWGEAKLADLSTSFDGVTTMQGTAAADTIVGTSGNDIIDGGAGGDLLQGGAGSDHYLWGPGSGSDVIEENGAGDTLEADTLVVGASSTDVEGTRVGRDVVLRIKSTGETLTIRDQFDDASDLSPTISPETGLEFVRFSDGVTWSAADIAKNAWLRAGATDSFVDGTSNDETYTSSGSASWLVTLSGHDTVDYTPGQGSVEVIASRETAGYPQFFSTPTFRDNVNLRIHGVTFDELKLSVQDSFANGGGGVTQPLPITDGDLGIRFAGSEGLILLKYYFSDVTDPATYTHDTITLDDGTVHALSDLIATAAIEGTDDADSFSVAPYGSGLVHPGKGDDQVYYATSGNTIMWSRGDGNDTYYGSQGSAALKLTDVDKADAVITQVGRDLVVTVGSEHLTIKDEFVGAWYDFRSGQNILSSGMDLKFADGAMTRADLAQQFSYVGEGGGGDVFYGQDYGQNISLSEPYSVVYAGSGDDIIHVNDGYVVAGNGNDLVHAGSAYVVAGDGDDQVFGTGYVVGGDGNDTIVGVSQGDGGAGDDVITGGDGSSALFGRDGSDVLTAGAGGGYLEGDDGDDTLVAGGSFTVMLGGSGSDTYRWAEGSGSAQVIDSGGRLDGYDKLVLDGANRANFSIQLDGPNLVLADRSSGQTIQVEEQFVGTFDPSQPSSGVEEIDFADQVLDPSSLVSSGLFADDDQLGMQAGQTLTVQASNLLSNDYVASYRQLPDLAITSVSSQDGSVSLDSSGNVVFSTALTSGYASFSYTVGEGDASSSANVRVRIDGSAPSNLRDADETPNAVPDGAYGSTYTGIQVTADDADGDPLQYSLTDDAGGRFFIDGSGGVYVNWDVPVDAGQQGGYQIVVEASDGVLSVDQAFTIAVTPFNDIDGTTGDDVITGTAGADLIRPGDGNDQVSAGGGDDRIIGGTGDDTLDGGAGFDTAILTGSSGGYQLTVGGGGYSVTDTDPSDGDEGTDTLVGIEQLRASDTYWNLASPIVLDLDGDGIQLTDKADSRAKFDWNGDGVRDQTGWIGSGDGLLFDDRDSNGMVTDARELSFVDDRPGAKSDLDGLRALDSDGDRKLTATDAAWSRLKVWLDGNGDGVADRSEVRTLDEVGIKSIDLTGHAGSGNVSWGGNVLVNTGSFQLADGSSHVFDDAAFSYDIGHSAAATTPISSAAARFAQASANFPEAVLQEFHDNPWRIGGSGREAFFTASRLA